MVFFSRYLGMASTTSSDLVPLSASHAWYTAGNQGHRASVTRYTAGTTDTEHHLIHIR